MKTLGKSLLFSLLLTLAITAFLNVEKLDSTKADVKTLEVAAGAIPVADPTSPSPLSHCYPVATSDELDIRTRMDFEARTSAGWVLDREQSVAGQFCLAESPDAVRKRLEEQD